MSFFLLLNTKQDILKNVGNQTVDFANGVPFGYQHLSIQNIIFCVQQKKEIHTGLKYHEGEYIMTEFSL